jgi:hypothetical protein
MVVDRRLSDDNLVEGSRPIWLTAPEESAESVTSRKVDASAAIQAATPLCQER